MLLREQQRKISCDLAAEMVHEMLPILLGTSMMNKRERDEIDYGRGYIAGSLGQSGDINRDITFVNFLRDIVSARSFSNFNATSYVPYNTTHTKVMTLQLSVRPSVRTPFTPMQRMQLPLTSFKPRSKWIHKIHYITVFTLISLRHYVRVLCFNTKSYQFPDRREFTTHTVLINLQ